MDLKSFVSTTLTQVIDGIRDAQEQPNGGHVAAEGYISSQGNLLNGGTSGYFTMVDFDVSVAAESVDGGKTIHVAGVGTSDASKTASSNLSRVKFSVHLRIPKGDANAAERETGISRHGFEYDPFDNNRV